MGRTALRERLARETNVSSRRRFDPRVSIAVLAIVTVAVSGSGDIPFGLACFAIGAAAMAWCGCWRWLGACALFAGTVLAVIQLSPLFAGAAQGVTASFISLWRVVPGATFAVLFISTTNLGELACALRRAGLPTNLTVAIGVGLRFFPKAAKEGKIVAEAMKSRGLLSNSRELVRHPSRSLEAFFVPYLHRVAILAGEIGNAVVSRGAENEAMRTSLYEVRIMPRDVVLLFAVCATVCAFYFPEAVWR